MKWDTGRQKTGYEKLSFFQNRFIDLYLLKFPPGSYVPPHQDVVMGKRHYRLNIILKAAQKGGDFVCRRTLFKLPRIVLFRPDREIHEVTKVHEGTRYVLSVGWAR